MNSQEGRSNSLQLTQQRSQKLDKKTPLKRIRIGENNHLSIQGNHNKTSLSYIHTTSNSQINFSKHDIPNSPTSIVHLEQYIKESVDYGRQGNQKGQRQRNFQEQIEKIEINRIDNESNMLPPLRESSKQLIENNSNTISQLVQSCKKINITSFGNIPFNNMSPKSEKGFSINGGNKINMFNQEQINQIIHPTLKVQIVPSQRDINKNINQPIAQSYLVNQVSNASSIQGSTMVKEKLQSLQTFCSPNTLSTKKLKQEIVPESKVESFATPTSLSSKNDDTKQNIMKKQFSERILKLIKTDSPLRMQQSSVFTKNHYYNNIQSLNKTQCKDSQTYSSIEKSTHQQQTNISSLGKKRATMQEFFTNRLNQKITNQQDKMQSSDNFFTKQSHTSSQQTSNKLSTSSITQYSKLEDISKIMQMQVSSALTDVPRNRADLKELIKWFESVKKQNEDQNKYNIEEKRKKQQEIIQVCFKELSHQIRIDFLEREQFFKIIWNENINYYKSFIEDFEQIKLKINTNADSEYNRVSNFYQQYIKTKDLAAEEAFQEKRIVERKLEELKLELNANHQIQQTLKEEVNKFKKICMFLKKKLVTVTKELEGVMQRQEDRARHSKHQLNEYFKDQMSKLKLQGLEISSQNEQTIQNLIEQLRYANENLGSQQKQNQGQENKDGQEEQQKNKNHLEEEEEEQEDDDNFTFEYNEGGDLVQGVDQLNAVIVNTEQEIKKECKETAVDDSLRQMYMKDVEVQTKLYLVDSKFDAVLYDVETMNDIFDFYVYKQQMDEQVEKFDVNQFMQQLGESDQAENQNFVQTITNIRMDSIEESSSNKSSSSSSSGSDSDSSNSDESETEDQTKKQKKENKKKSLPRQSKLLQNLNPQLIVTTAKKDYDSLRGFQQRQSIRQRLSIRQNVFNSNRHLALYLEQYLSSNFINDIISIFAEKINGQGDANLSTTANILEVPSMLQQPRVVGGPRKSILNMIDSNPFVQKKRNELKQKLNQLLDPEKLKTVLDDAGLKVTSSNTESKLEKFVKIYQMSQLKGQELQVQLKGAKQMLDKYQEDLKLNTVMLEDKEQLTEEQKVEINRLEQVIRDLQNELEMALKREKEVIQQMKKGTLENIDDSDMQVKLKQPRIFRQRREKKEVTAFQLGKKINIEWEFQKQQNSGKQIVEKAKNKKMAKFHNFMTVKTVLKQISILYNERMIVTKENSNYKDIEFSNFVYNFYSSQYGVKKIADQKFLILILSIKKYSQILRINMFSRFLGLQEGNINFTTDELNKYIDVLDFINNISQAGTNFTNNESEQKYLVPYIKAVHYITQFGDSRMKQEENQELRKDVESMKFMDSNKTAVLDFDQFMNRMLATYKILVNRAKQYVINAFNACDLDGNKKCNFNEWSMLNRHIEPDKFDDDQIIQIFEDNADIIEEDGEKNLSFDKFAVVSLEYELFSDEAQDRYLEITNPLQFKIKYDQLMQIWPSKSIEIQKRFYNLQNIEEQTKEDWLNIIKVLEEKLNTLVFSNSNVKPLLIAYAILDRESNLLELDNIEYLKSIANIQNQSESPEKQSPV